MTIAPPPAVPAPPVQTRRFQKKQELILNAAARLFNRKGLKGATLSDVAESVGLSTTSVTYYYKRKEELAAACYLRAMAQINAMLEEAEREAGAEARLERMLQLYFSAAAAVDTGDMPEPISFYDIRALTGPMAEEVFAAFNALFRRTRALLWGQSGLSRTEQNSRTHLVFSLVLEARQWVRRYEVEDYAPAAARMADILIGGMGAAGASWAPGALAELEPPAEDTRDAFLRAATQLINEQGYHGASVEKISSRLSVTKGAFYHHNDTKDDLVAACFQRSFDVIRRVQRAAAKAEGSAWTRLCTAADTLVRHQLSSRGPLLRYTALNAVPEAIRPDLEDTMGRLAERYATWVVDGLKDGSVRPVDPFIAGRLVNGMVNLAANLERWAPDATCDTAPDLLAKPLFMGVLR